MKKGEGMVVAVPLTQGYTCLIDDEDADFINQWKWSVINTGSGRMYAARFQKVEGKPRLVLMHRTIIGMMLSRETYVDHIDGDGLNNRGANLRPVTPAQNMQNRRGAQRGSKTGVRGVYIDKKSGTYRAHVRVNHQFVLRKSFATLEEANQAARMARALYMTHSSECAEPMTIDTAMLQNCRGAAQTSCQRSHPFDEENTGWRQHANGRRSRVCRTCERARHRVNQAALRARQAAARTKA